MIDIELDGVDHINVYSRGRTQLGRDLSNFAHTPFVCADGGFASVEGYWYWLGTPAENVQRERLRTLHGFQAKALGKSLHSDDTPRDPDFDAKIRAAIDAKLKASPMLMAFFADSRLPLLHYYVFKNGHVVQPEKHRWVLEHLEKRRLDLQAWYARKAG